MKIQTPTEFQTFNDGFCDIYTVKGNQKDEKLLTLCFEYRTIGYKRHYAARAASTKIDQLIQIPGIQNVTTVNRAVICGVEYKIDAVQQLRNTNPPATVLTLQKVG